jgi:rhodanese-related sulfurtransferase
LSIIELVSRRRSGFIFLALGGCTALPETSPPALSITLASDVGEEVAAGAILVDVRGPTERRRDGVPRQRHHFVTFGQDNFRTAVTPAELQLFLSQMRERAGPPGRPIILLCSVGVRSAEAARGLGLAGYSVSNVMDGWLGNDAGPGLRALER